MLGRIEHLTLVAREPDGMAAPGPVHDGRDVLRGDVRGRVHVRDEPDHGSARHAWQAREDVRVLRQAGVVERELAQLAHEQPRELELLLRARPLRLAVGGLRVDPRVAEQPLEDVLRELLGERARECRGLGRPASQARRAA